MGISGLKTAFDLMQNSSHLISSITFFEKNAELGGVLNHTSENHFLCEHGAQGVLLSRPSFLQSIQELDLKNDLLVPQKGLGTRFLIQNGKCIPISLNIFYLMKEKLLNLTSFIKIVKVFLFKKQSPPRFNESLYEFFLRHLGKKIADNFLIPFSFGIWGGGAHKILCRYCFSKFPVLKFKKKPQGLASFEQGMNFLPKSLYFRLEDLCQKAQVQLNVKLNTNVLSIHRAEENLIINDEHRFDIIIYAGQPWREENLSFGSSQNHKQAFDTLKQIPTHSLAVVGLGGEKNLSFSYKEGFGALANKDSRDLLGILFIHSTYKKHAPENGFLYRILFGGDRHPDINSLNDKELFERAKKHLENLQLLAGNEKITFTKIFRYENYIPLATEYQDKVLCALWQLEALNPGLFFTGNYIKGVSVADCLEQAKLTATKVTNFILEQS